jgi:serine/threonine protein kinase
MGTVFRAEHVQLHRQVALKIINPDLVQDPRIRERFAREAVREILHFGTELEALVSWLERSVESPVSADPDRFLPMGPKAGAAGA